MTINGVPVPSSPSSSSSSSSVDSSTSKASSAGRDWHIEVRDPNGKINRITTFEEKPRSPNATLEERYVEVIVDGQTRFAKVGDLAKALNMDSQNVLSKTSEDLNGIIQKHQRIDSDTIKLINALRDHHVISLGTMRTREVRTLYRSLRPISDAVKKSDEKIAHLLSRASTPESRTKLLNSLTSVGQLLAVHRDADTYEASHGYLVTKDKQVFFPTDTILGAGSFKDVGEAVDLQESQLHARAIVKGEKHISSFQVEQAILEKLQGLPHIVKPYKISVVTKDAVGEPILVAIQHRYEGSVKRLVPTPGPTAIFQSDVRTIVGILQNAATGLAAMHEAGLVHSDIKPDNLLIQTNSAGRKEAFVHDFGLSAMRSGSFRGGTPNYSPPEKIRLGDEGIEWTSHDYAPDSSQMHEVDPVIDSFSLGVMGVELITGSPLLASGIPLGLSTQAEGDALIDNYINQLQTKNSEIENQIKDASANLSATDRKQLEKQQEENEAKIELLKTCKNLLKTNPKDRMSCATAAEEFRLLEVDLDYVE